MAEKDNFHGLREIPNMSKEEALDMYYAAKIQLGHWKTADAAMGTIITKAGVQKAEHIVKMWGLYIQKFIYQNVN